MLLDVVTSGHSVLTLCGGLVTGAGYVRPVGGMPTKGGPAHTRAQYGAAFATGALQTAAAACTNARATGVSHRSNETPG